MNITINKFQTPQQAASALAKRLHLLINAILKNKDFVSLAVSGGNTPALLFKELAVHYSNKIPWGKIHLFWVDERCVSPSDRESNYGMTKELLLDKIRIPAGNIHRIHGEYKKPETEALRYSEELKKHLPHSNGFPEFDIMLLGTGSDGHTASIFSDQKFLLTSSNAVETAIHPQTGQHRITLTGKTINNSAAIFFFVTGNEKAGMISEIINKKKGFENYSASGIKPVSGNLKWFLDQESASLL